MENVRKSMEVLADKVRQLPPWALAVGGTVVGYTLLRTFVLSRSSVRREAKGDWEVPIFGNLFNIGDIQKLFEYQLTLVKKYGGVAKFSLLGRKFVITSDPEMNKRIFQNDMNDFGRGGNTMVVFGDIAGGLIIQDNGIEQKEVRKYFDPSFSVGTIKSYAPIVTECTSKLLTWMDTQLKSPENHPKGAGIEMQPALHGLTFDIIVNILLGFDPNSVATGGQAVHIQAWEHALSHLMDRFPFAESRYWEYSFLKTPAVRQYEKDIKVLRDLVMNRYDMYLKDGVPTEAVDMLAQYVRRLKANPETVPDFLKNDRESFQRHFITQVFAGHDTTASSIGWTLAFLSMSPEKLDRARKEVIQTVGKGSLTYENLLTMPYLEACVKETLRLRPSAPNTGRIAAKDLTYNWVDDQGVAREHFVEKGTELFTCFYATHLDERNFEKASQFWPERWLSDKVYSPWSYIPFGAGPRRCLGEKLALFETRLAVAEILRKYDFGLVEGHKMEAIQAPTFRMKHGLKMWLKAL
ncbi:hypothetical protein SmJEL517_g02413 [Synchytrium microbalum]|uniref:Unspecific monooxygenase n=1 Tax=Synchytrium microbalum TaxID=1806994 RepID=A0A507C6V6_9FUNG|nr:uncharacterized protein SmJEL517_g02413 [Synchytrium microbalum]TPX35078.1 hypothetical protein SmJEL517_g02413 [Synchytrium microbalum]